MLCFVSANDTLLQEVLVGAGNLIQLRVKLTWIMMQSNNSHQNAV